MWLPAPVGGPGQATITHTHRDLGAWKEYEITFRVTSAMMEITHSPISTPILDGLPRGCRTGTYSFFVRRQVQQGWAERVFRGVKQESKQHSSDPRVGKNIYPLITQGPSFFWQSLPEKPGAQEHSYWPESRFVQVPLLAQGVEAHARTSGVGREKQTLSPPPPGREKGTGEGGQSPLAGQRGWGDPT